MSDNALGTASTDFTEQDQHNTSRENEATPAESAQEAAAIMGVTETAGGQVSGGISGAGGAPTSGGAATDAPPSSAPGDGNASGGAGSGSNGSPSVASVAAPLVDTAKQHAQKALEQTKSAAGDALGQAKQKTTSWVETQLDMAADSLHNVADAVRQTGQQFGSQDPNLKQIAEVATTAASSVEGISSRLRDATVDEIITETESFARRQPSLFIGAAFAVGFVLARFLKSTGAGGTARIGASVASQDRLLPVPLDQEPQFGQPAGR